MKAKIFYTFLLIILAVFGVIYLLNNFFFVSKADLYSDNRFVISNGLENNYEISGQVILADDGGTIYVPIQLLRESFDVKADYDENNHILIITTLDKVIRFYDENLVKVNNNEDKNIPAMIVQGEEIFVPVSHLKEFINLEVKHTPETNATILTNLEKDRNYFEVTKETGRLRSDSKIFSSVITTTLKGEKIQLIKDGQKWIKVLTESGHSGYISKKSVMEVETIEGLKATERPKLWPEESGKVLLTWEHVHSRNPDTSEIGELNGLNVISPTWLHLKDETGKIESKIDKDYIQWAKGRGYEIWVLFDNQFDPDLTHAFLDDAQNREIAIANLLDLVVKNGMDGINIDFENVYLKDKENLVQFVRELVPVFHEKDLLVSMDVTVKSLSENWSMFYDREALGEVLDFMAIMAYDEHWASSPESGSVASIGWVEKGIQGILEEVPAEKLLLGMPLYTRVWTETHSEEGVHVTSRAVSMETVNELIEKYDLQKVWDETTAQHYVEYKIGEKINKIWIEDGKSIEEKYNLIHKYNLAGAALWRRGFETPDIWRVLVDSEIKDK